MRYRYVFLLGRAGCGKSAVYRQLKKRLRESGLAKSFQRVDDFPKVWALIMEDDAREAEGEPRRFFTVIEEGDYAVIDDSFFDIVLQQVNREVLAIDRPDHMVFIEFARSDYIGAIQHFDPRILGSCLVVYVDVSFETCWARNLARHQAALELGTDDHFVPRGEMEKQYKVDDRDALMRYLKHSGIPRFVLDNEPEGEEHLVAQVDLLIEKLF